MFKSFKKLNNNPKIKGLIGERKVNQILNKFNYKYHSIKLKTPKKTQIDHILITNDAIFVIETKNYQGFVFESNDKKNFIVLNNNKRTIYNSPIIQNDYHIKNLSHHLSKYKNYLKSLIVFMDSANIKSIEYENVINYRSLYKYIKTYQTKNKPITDNEIIEINTIITNLNK